MLTAGHEQVVSSNASGELIDSKHYLPRMLYVNAPETNTTALHSLSRYILEEVR